MPSFDFRDPWLLLTVLLAIPVYRLARRRPGALLYSSLGLLPHGSGSVRARFLWLPAACLAGATACLGTALAGPRVGDAFTRVQKKGIAIMMCVDQSGSMAALDLSEDSRERTRLDAVKEVFHDFVAGEGGLPGRPNDAIGVVSFARYADCRCPLTLDHPNLLSIAADLAIVTEREEDGTAMGDGLGLALERLRETKAESKVAVLLTDGVQNAGELTPEAAAQMAEALGIKVYTVGAGTNGLAPIRAEDPFTGRMVLQRVPVQIDEDTLKSIAARTGGRYFRATDAEALRQVYQEIDRLERSTVAEVRYLQYHEHYETFCALALGLALLGWTLGATWLRSLP